jgi:hypothetical protein
MKLWFGCGYAAIGTMWILTLSEKRISEGLENLQSVKKGNHPWLHGRWTIFAGSI